MIMRIPLLRTVCKAIVAKADWDESKHPRADNGQFGSGSGSSKPKKPSKTRRKMERREEAASQARVGGAIQSLLSGGSALDKIGWFKQPEPEKPKAKKPAPEKKPAEEPGDSEPSILDTMAQSWSQSEAMRGKVPTLEHPSQRSAREGGPEGGHSPRVLTRTERDYRDSQNQWDNDRRRMGIPVPGDELATLEIPAKPKQPEKPKAEEKPKEESDVDRHQRLQAERKQFIQDSSAKLLANLRSGKVTPEDAEKVKRELGHKSFDLVREMRPMKDGKELDAKIAEGKHIADKIEAIEAALKAHKDEQPTKPIDWSKVRSKPGESSVRDDPLPRGYGTRSPEETARYMREHPPRSTPTEEYDQEYERRTGRKFDPTTA